MNKYYSPITNAELIKLDSGYYKSNYDDYYYRIIGNTPVALKDPNNGGPLIPNDNGNFISIFSNESFHYDSIKDIFIPLYIDIPEIANESAFVNGNYMIGENTGIKYVIKEDAHIEGDYLVGNQTGRKFLIGENGIIIPDEYTNYHFDYKDDNIKYVPQKIDDNIDNITRQIVIESSKENGIKSSLINYLTYLKDNMDKTQPVDIELLFKIMNNQEIDDIILENRLKELKQNNKEEKSK